MKMTTNNGYASRADFLAPPKRRFKDVYLPASKQTVRIRSLFEGEKEQYEAGLVNAKGDPTRETMLNSRCRLIIACLCDGEGNPTLSEADMDKMRQLDGADLAYLQEECQIMCGFQKGDISDIEKNSEPVRADS